MRALMIVLSLLFFQGCSSNDLPDYFRLEGLRILAVVADKPEISASETATLTLFVSDIGGGGRSLTLDAEACVDPGVSLGADPDCGSDAIPVAADLPLTGLSAPEYTGSITETLAITPGTTAPSETLLFANRSETEKHNGVPILVTIRVSAPEGTEQKLFKRILVSTRSTRNANPILGGQGILHEGSPLSELPSQRALLLADVTSASIESYVAKTQSGTEASLQEQIIVSWFVSDGELIGTQTDFDESTKWDPPTSRPEGRNAVIVAVVRDRRGGTAVFIKEL